MVFDDCAKVVSLCVVPESVEKTPCSFFGESPCFDNSKAAPVNTLDPWLAPVKICLVGGSNVNSNDTDEC